MRSSRPILSAAVAIGAIVGIGAASAADLPARTYTKAPMISPAYNWSGFYIGASVGGDWIQRDDAVLSLPPGTPQLFLPFLANGSIPTNYSTSGAGVIGGGQVGYNWQMQNIVFGVEADISGLSNRNTQTQLTNVAAAGFSFALAYSTKVDYLGTVRGRIGAVVSPNVMIYATGGFAYGQVNHTYSETFGPLGGAPVVNQTFGSASHLDTGWTAGAGLEWAVTNNVTIRGEYLYVNLTSDSFTTPSNNATCGVPNACSFTLSPSNLGLNIVRAGINYKWGGPIVARY